MLKNRFLTISLIAISLVACTQPKVEESEIPFYQALPYNGISGEAESTTVTTWHVKIEEGDTINPSGTLISIETTYFDKQGRVDSSSYIAPLQNIEFYYKNKYKSDKLVLQTRSTANEYGGASNYQSSYEYPSSDKCIVTTLNEEMPEPLITTFEYDFDKQTETITTELEEGTGKSVLQYENHQLVQSENKSPEVSSFTKTFYTNNCRTKVEQTLEGSFASGKRVTTFEYLSFDEHNNWREKISRPEGEEQTYYEVTQREIVYK